jgi:hypothetical protein
MGPKTGAQKYPCKLVSFFGYASSLSKDIIRRLFSDADDNGRNVFHFCIASQDVAAATQQFCHLLSLMPPDLADSLAAQRDKNGYSPYHLARLRRNATACRILTSEFGATNGPNPLDLRTGEGAFTTIQELLVSREEKMKTGDAEREEIMEECEYSGSKRTLEPAEIRHQSDVDKAIHLEGEDSQRVVWCMDSLGTVHERYGRLQKAQDVYHRGWLKSLRVLGPKSPVTQDFAAKILRVLRDRGVATEEVPFVANWHAINGRNTPSGRDQVSQRGRPERKTPCSKGGIRPAG